MGPLLTEIAACFPGVERIYRTEINSWHDERIEDAIKATGGPRKVICAGITADFCIGLPAMSIAAEAYDVRLVMDASGTDSTMVLQATIANLTQRGVHTQGWINTACELQANCANEETANGLNAIFDAHDPPWLFLSLAQKSYIESMGAK